MSLPTIKVGNDDVPALAWGAMGLSSFYGPIPDDATRLALLDTLHALGLRNWDTADCYGDSEDLLGRWFKQSGKRGDVFLATKCGFVMGPGTAEIDGSPEHIREAVESSLKRLGVEYVDLLYLHRPDAKVPIETSVGAMAELVKEGKVKYIGLSECNGATLRRACAIHPIAAVQVEYSPFELIIESAETALLSTAKELGVPIFAYSPLGRGMLSGRFKSPDDFDPTDNRRLFPRFSKENFPNVLKIVSGLTKIGARHNATPSQIALAWLIAQGDVVPIFGASRPESAKENVGSLSVRLGEEEVREVRELAEMSGACEGARYPEWFTVKGFCDTPLL